MHHILLPSDLRSLDSCLKTILKQERRRRRRAEALTADLERRLTNALVEIDYLKERLGSGPPKCPDCHADLT
jgi:hypothetical protein